MLNECFRGSLRVLCKPRCCFSNGIYTKVNYFKINKYYTNIYGQLIWPSPALKANVQYTYGYFHLQKNIKYITQWIYFADICLYYKDTKQ